MNSSSLFKTELLVVLAVLAIIVAAGSLLAFPDVARSIAIGASVLALLALAGAFLFLTRACSITERAADLCTRAARGELEGRVLEIPEPGRLGRLQTSVNNLLDITDAYVRELTGAMHGVSEGRYHRKVLERGLPGAYLVAARTINAAMTAMESRVEEFGRFTESFEKGVGTVVVGVLIRRDPDAKQRGLHDHHRERNEPRGSLGRRYDHAGIAQCPSGGRRRGGTFRLGRRDRPASGALVGNRPARR